MEKYIKKRFSISNENKPFYGAIYIILGLVSFFICYFVWTECPTHNGWYNFIKEVSGPFTVISFLYSFFAVLLGSINWSPDVFHHIQCQQKERIKILDDFAKENWFSTDKTIYNELINMLDRCALNKEDGFKLLMLMCCPTLDYPERLKDNFNKWGDEFRNKIEPIIPDNNNKIELKIFHLPNENISGVNPLVQFIESLSGFCAALPNTKSTSKEIFTQISRETKNYLGYLKIKSEHNSNFTVSSVEQPDVPFQIFIYKSKKYCEVLVSFAGKTILQDKNETKQKGFQSIDPDVVKAFEHIFNSYTATHRRIPIKPIHSLDIIDNLSKADKHRISDYLNLNILLEIDKGIFSPCYANSSKFTSYAITKILKKEDKVLDIGSGTGVQALVSYRYLQDYLSTPNPVVWAIEPFIESYDNLKRNITLNRMNIIAKKWLLYTGNRYNNKDRNQNITVGKIIDSTSNTIRELKLLDFENNLFDVVIGDLPYVDTKADESLEHAFFDLEHNAHRALFRMFAKEQYIKNDSKLITSFSSLGGLDDIVKFESIISKNELVILQRFAFNENDYLWYVYVIVKKTFFNSFCNEYWWKTLNCHGSVKSCRS